MVGRKVGHYRVLEQLGAGGMGVVYRAHDERLERDVALKFLPPEPALGETAHARLLREARSASALNHPNICQVYEIGHAEGGDFIAMELIEGASLAERLSHSALPVRTAIRYGIQIADALAHAHERGVVHRDLKSANVMITADGRVKVLDFGLAKRTGSKEGGRALEASLTGTGMVVGTPSYFAPEVLTGEPASPRSDLWALGVVLYEMITGRLPFQGRTWVELSSAIVNDEPAPLPGRVPNGYRSVVQRCLAKDPAHRYRGASEVRAALEAIDFDSSEQSVASRSRWRGRRAAALAAAVTALAVIAAFAFDLGGVRSTLARSGGGSGGARIRSLAVLPLANLSGDPNQDFFAAGMTEELITSLAPIRDLKVISRTSVMRYKGTEKPVPQIARELGVDGIVEGSVTRAGERVRITAQLIDAPRDKHLWARSYERDLKEVLTLQREVASDIAQEIQVQIAPQAKEGTSGPRTLDPRAYELYLRGRYEWGTLTPEGTRRAAEYFQKAIQIDPGDARAYAGLADAYLIQGYMLGTVPLPIAMAKVKEYSSKALALDESLPEAHAAMATAVLFIDWDLATAEREVRRAIELNPGYTGGHMIYSMLLGMLGRRDEAMGESRRAIELDPLSLLNNWNMIYLYAQDRQFDQAVAQAKRCLELAPNSQVVTGVLLRVYEWKNDYPAAIDLLDRSIVTNPQEKAFVASLRKAYAAGGKQSYLRTWLDMYLAMAKADPNPDHAAGVALTYARLGERDHAFQWLDRCLSARQSDLLWLRVNPDFDLLRADPRYAALARKIGLPAS